jgi:hypothetical protein
VRRIEVQGRVEQGAVPSTKACDGETKVTDVAAKPPGTGPPVGRATAVGRVLVVGATVGRLEGTLPIEVRWAEPG